MVLAGNPCVSTCKVPSYVAHQHGTSGRQFRSNGRSGAVGVISRGELGAEAEGEMEGVPLTITPPLYEYQLDVEESEIGWKGIEVKARVQMQCGAPRFLVWNSVTFSGAWLRFSEYFQVFSSIP